LATQSAYAQDGSASGNQEKAATSQRNEPEAEPVWDAQIPAAPFKPSRWFSRVGFLGAPYHSSATIATNGRHHSQEFRRQRKRPKGSQQLGISCARGALNMK